MHVLDREILLCMHADWFAAQTTFAIIVLHSAQYARVQPLDHKQMHIFLSSLLSKSSREITRAWHDAGHNVISFYIKNLLIYFPSSLKLDPLVIFPQLFGNKNHY